MRPSLLSVTVAAVAALAVASSVTACGCSWGDRNSEVTSDPDSPCVVAAVDSSCAEVSLTLDNGCDVPLALGDQVVRPGESASLPVGTSSVTREDGRACVDHFEVEVTLGDQVVTLHFWVEAVNRGAFGC